MSDRDDLEAAIPRTDARVQAAIDHVWELLGDAVEGVGQGATSTGEPSLVVMVAYRSPELDARIPETIEGLPVEVVETGTFTAAD